MELNSSLFSAMGIWSLSHFPTPLDALHIITTIRAQAIPTQPTAGSPSFPNGHCRGPSSCQRDETTAPPTHAWPLAFQPCAQSLTFSAAGCRCVLCYRNSPAPGPLRPALSSTQRHPHLPGSRGVRQDQREVLSSPFPSHTPLTEQSRMGPASPSLLPAPVFLLCVCCYNEMFGRVRHERGIKKWR